MANSDPNLVEGIERKDGGFQVGGQHFMDYDSAMQYRNSTQAIFGENWMGGALDGINNYFKDKEEQYRAQLEWLEEWGPKFYAAATVSAKPYFEEAEKLDKAGEPYKALAKYKEALDQTAKYGFRGFKKEWEYGAGEYSGPALYRSAEICLEKEQYSQALKFIDEGVKREYKLPDGSDPKFLRAEILTRDGRGSHAISDYKDVVEAGGKNANTAKQQLKDLGVSYEKGNWKKYAKFGAIGAAVFGIFGIVTSSGSNAVIGFILGAIFGFVATYFVSEKIIEKKGTNSASGTPQQSEPVKTVSAEEKAKNLAQLIESGSVDMIYSKAFNANEEEDYATAFPLFQKAAEMGHSEAQYKLALLYKDGKGVDKNPEQAAMLLKKLLEENAENINEYDRGGAQLALGEMYRDGKGIPKDIEKARYWLKLATNCFADDIAKEAKKALKELK